MTKTILCLHLIAACLINTWAMVDLTAQKTYEGTNSKMPLFSLGVLHHGPEKQYFETGAMVRPVHDSASVGTYGAYYYSIWPIFRPGIIAGVVFKKQRKWGTSLYYGISIHVGIFTFVATGEGIGGGLNIPIGNR